MRSGLEHLPRRPVNIFLRPGEVHFGDRNTRISTLLGSCVSIVMWHPLRLIGGMSHILLPERSRNKPHELDGRYADDAICLLLRQALNAGTRPGEYIVKVFGGGNMFPGHKPKLSQIRHDYGLKPLAGGPRSQVCEHCGLVNCSVGCRNIGVVRQLLLQHGLTLVAEDIGGVGHRMVIFDIASGETWVRQSSINQL